MPPLRFARVETSLGPTWVAETDAGVAAVSRSGSLDAFLAPLGRRFPGFEPEPADLHVGWLDAALGGGGPLPRVDLGGLSAFDARVYEAVRAVPAGETVTYGEVAALVGSPGAARAVGGAMARCPLFPAVPCHRVVRAADGWSGWGGDVELKRGLLRAERAQGPIIRGRTGRVAERADLGRR
jgi:AraC family transcriptional regulator of adaptative response/methylated-DNA-[protein]-cysteine methyltransferase